MKNLHKKFLSSCVAFMVCLSVSFAQEPPMKTLQLNDMSSFKDQAGNWFIVGDVSMNPNVDVHHKEGKKRRKRKNQAVTYTPGEGVLLNINTKKKKSQLITTWEHGDIELEMEVMLPKGSNSGIYLQGRYEVQLFDSWGVEDAKFSDMGGIYRNWSQEPGKIYSGKAPLSNAAKAPGLWQTLKISFRAPRFNADGEKIANARFLSVVLNGVKIHDNIEVPLPTGGPIENNEQPTGPLMIQGDHGPVAFRNIRYRLLTDSEVKLTDLKYQVYYKDFESLDDFKTAKSSLKGTSSGLTWQVVEKDTVFALRYTGNISIPKDDTYHFELTANTQAQLSIAGQKIVVAGPDGKKSSVDLKKGDYPIEIIYYRDVLWKAARLGLTVRSTGTHEKELNTAGSFPPDYDAVNPILVKTGAEPKLLRAFLDFEGDRSKRLTHTIAVGGPDGVHYIYDLKAGNLACVWRGPFIDATTMWYGRGDGSFEPMGLLQYLFMGPSLAALNTSEAAFPEKYDRENFTPKGYVIDENTGRPTFKYRYKGMKITDQIYPDKESKKLFREVHIENINDDLELYFKLAEGEAISVMPDGSYVVDEHFYIKVLSPQQPEIRTSNGEKELVLEMDGTPLKYSIIW